MALLRARCAMLGGLLAALLGAAAARAADPAHRPPAEPDPAFLEFLGSVDRLADMTPEFLAKADLARARASVKSRTAPGPAPAAPQQAATGPPQGATGSKNNESRLP